MKSFQQKVGKPWGYEIILTSPESPVTGKILHLNAGCRFSLQYHDKKQETLTLFSGEAEIILENENGALQKAKMEPKRGYFIKPFQKHRVEAITDCDIFEVSTPEEGKTIRIEDDYARGTETEAERKKRKQSGVYMG